MPNLDTLRSQFPALNSPWALLDNAGGTLACNPVIRRVEAYMSSRMVQVGASYDLSAAATLEVEQGRQAIATLMGAGPSEVVLGPSSTSLLGRLARGLVGRVSAGDEIVVTDLDHESNIGCWRRLARERGATVRVWHFNPDTLSLDSAGLQEVMGPKTRIVAFGHVSNLIGQLHDVPALCEQIREQGAISVVDGVAAAPHRRPDARLLGADAYAFSIYKVFGAHQAALWMSPALALDLENVNHFFIGEGPGRFELGGSVHELSASHAGVVEYLESVADGGSTVDERLDAAYAWIADHESRLAGPLLAYLDRHPRIRLLGTADPAPEKRVPTVSFVVKGTAASQLPPALDEQRVAVRWGHFYAVHAVEALGLEELDGVVRASMVHYNSPEEVQRLIEALDLVLDRSPSDPLIRSAD